MRALRFWWPQKVVLEEGPREQHVFARLWVCAGVGRHLSPPAMACGFYSQALRIFEEHAPHPRHVSSARGTEDWGGQRNVHTIDFLDTFCEHTWQNLKGLVVMLHMLLGGGTKKGQDDSAEKASAQQNTEAAWPLLQGRSLLQTVSN